MFSLNTTNGQMIDSYAKLNVIGHNYQKQDVVLND